MPLLEDKDAPTSYKEGWQIYAIGIASDIQTPKMAQTVSFHYTPIIQIGDKKVEDTSRRKGSFGKTLAQVVGESVTLSNGTVITGAMMAEALDRFGYAFLTTHLEAQANRIAP